ncbi:MAG: VOC family protein [Pseudomonadota bacterium]
MLKHFDHVTIAVRDLSAAKEFFALLGFEEDQSVVISGERFAEYMDVPGIEADHVTLVFPGTMPRLEVQLLHYRKPHALENPLIGRLDKLGFNHICFAVEDIDAMIEHLKAHGVEVRSELTTFHDRHLYFLTGPEGVTVELAQWES